MGRSISHIVQFLTLILLCFTTESGVAQVADFTGKGEEISNSYEYGDFLRIGITSKLISESYYQDIRFKSSLLKEKSVLKKSKKRGSEPGEEKDFFVRNILAQNTWNSTTAVLSYSEPGINIWVQKTAYDTLSGTSLWTEIEQRFDEFLYQSTPPNSVLPEEGVLKIMDRYVGKFPDVDNDQTLDVLLLDIQDDFEGTGSFVAGFFDPVNLYEFEYSNERDLIYLDIYPTLIFEGDIHIERMMSTFVHESQHLIHAGYEGEEEEAVFVNEGFSEAVEILCGFEPRNEKPFQDRPLRALLNWDFDNPLPDYSRASLWMHYLIEQLGPHQLKDFIQNTTVGIEGYREVIESHSSRKFEEVFRDWGLALMVNDRVQHSAFGYAHSSRQHPILEPLLEVEALPEAFSEQIPGWVHLPVNFPLTRELEFSIDGYSAADTRLSSVVSYPADGKPEVELVDESSLTIYADQKDHGSIQTLVSFMGNAENEQHSFSFFADGKPSGRFTQQAYGDGNPDAFYQNASYLSLNGGNQRMGVVFPPASSVYWLRSLFIRTLFQSELENSGIDGEAPRNFTVDIFSVRNRLPDQKIIPTQLFEAQRASGKLVAEVFSLADFYQELSAIKDSIMIIVGNDAGDQNFIALGMDRGTQSASYFSDEATNKEGWISLAEKSVGGTSLENWNPIIQVGVVLTDVNEWQKPMISDISYTFSGVEVKVVPELPYDSLSVKLSARLPDGSFAKGELISKEKEAFTFTLPLLVNGDYTLLSRYTSPEGDEVFKDEQEWGIDVPNGFELSHNYPNPFNPATTVPFLLLEKASVGWEIFDVTGRLVSTIAARQLESGQYSQVIELRDQASGMYFVRARLNRERTNGTTFKIKKIMLIK